MALMSDSDRAEVNAEFQRDGRLGACGALTKADVRAAINALDVFLNSNAAAINSAIPNPARSALTVSQKALLLVHVIQKRFIRGS